MKDILRSRVFQFIITAIVFTGVGVLAESGINASIISYTDRNNNQTTVKQALDGVYDNLDARIVANTFDTAQYALSHGNGMTNRTAELQLNKGKYIVALTYSLGSYYTTTQSLAGGSLNSTLSCDKDCHVTQLSGYYNKTVSTKKTPLNSTFYLYSYGFANLFYVDIEEDSTKVSSSKSESIDYIAQSLLLTAVKINEENTN